MVGRPLGADRVKRKDGESAGKAGRWRNGAAVSDEEDRCGDRGNEETASDVDHPSRLRGWRSRRTGYRGECRANRILQIVREVGGRVVPVLPSLFEAATNDSRELRRKRFERELGLRLLFQDRIQRFDLGIAPEGPASGQHLPEDDAEREDVGSAVDRLPADLLGAHVAHGSGDHSGLRGDRAPSRFVLHRAAERFVPLRQPEVENSREAGGCDHDVLGLDVAVDDALFVRRGESVRDFSGDLRRLPWTNRSARKPRSERLSRDELGDGIPNALLLPDIEKRHDVRVRQRGNGSGLLLEPADALRIRGKRRGENLDRDFPTEARVAGAVDLAHASPTEFALDFVGTQARAGQEAHGSEKEYPPTRCRLSSRLPFSLTARVSISHRMQPKARRAATSAQRSKRS